MPLIPQQEVITIVGISREPGPPQWGASDRAAAAELKRVLESYPPARIVSITTRSTAPLHAPVVLTAVIEFVKRSTCPSSRRRPRPVFEHGTVSYGDGMDDDGLELAAQPHCPAATSSCGNSPAG